MTECHPFDAAMHLDALGDGRYRGATSPEYANMIGPFGGLIAAIMLQSACLGEERLGDPTALTVNFCGPIADGVFEITTRAVRTNRSSQHWSMELEQGGGIAVTATAVFARRRPTWSRTEARYPDVPPANAVERAMAFRMPWAQRYAMRFVRGPFPSLIEDLPGAEPLTQVWLADDPPRPIDFVSLAALSDAFFPRIFLRRPIWTPIGTVSLTVYIHADANSLAAQADRPVLGSAWASHFGNGMFDEHVEVWSDDGHFLASAHQVVYFKE